MVILTLETATAVPARVPMSLPFFLAFLPAFLLLLPITWPWESNESEGMSVKSGQ